MDRILRFMTFSFYKKIPLKALQLAAGIIY